VESVAVVAVPRLPTGMRELTLVPSPPEAFLFLSKGGGGPGLKAAK